MAILWSKLLRLPTVCSGIGCSMYTRTASAKIFYLCMLCKTLDRAAVGQLAMKA